MSDWEEIDAAIVELTFGRHYVEIPEHNGIKAGARVRNRGEQYTKAREFGTATVVGVYQRKPSGWEAVYGRPDVEIVVNRDDPDRGPGPWADYGTALAEVQP